MATEIGKTLREARTRRRIELSEAEASTKIRVRFLRAMENEEWDVLPGDSYARGFIRTYAAYLGLDGERLADDFRKQHGGGREERMVRADPSIPPRPSTGQLGPSHRLPRLSRGAWAVLVSVGLVAILVGVALAGGGGDSTPEQAGTTSPTPPPSDAATGAAGEQPVAPGRVTLSLTARAEVWVCLLGADGEPLVGGEILSAGAEEGPFESNAFTMSLGNGDVELLLDGKPVPVVETPSPVGYEVRAGGELQPVAEEARPTCL